MLTYSMDRPRGESLYIHLYKLLRADILSGALPPGSRLPSKRSLAKHLGISVITVENAYAQLQSEGYLVARAKSGFFVAAIERPALAPPPAAPAAEQTKKETPTVPLLSLSGQRTAAESFPFSLWAKLMRDTLSARREALLQPSPAGGIPELRHAICQHLRQFRSLNVSPEQIIVGAGTEYLYSLLIQLLGFQQRYAVESPGYQKLPRIYASHGLQCLHIPLDEAGISVEALEAQGATVAHISPSHHFPTGMVTTISRRYELLAWASRDPGRFILEDDYDSEFRLSGRPIPTLQSIDHSGRVVYMNTFTKTLSPTIRISYMVLPPELLARFQQRLGFYACTVSTFEQYTLARFIGEGHFERHINRMRTQYRALRDELLSALRESALAPRLQVSNADSGLHFLLRVDTDLSDRALLARSAALGLSLSCLSQFGSAERPEPEHTLVLHYAGLRREELPTAVRLLEQALAP